MAYEFTERCFFMEFCHDTASFRHLWKADFFSVESSVCIRICPVPYQIRRAAAAGGEKVLRWFAADIIDEQGEVVARTRKQLYVRRKPGR